MLDCQDFRLVIDTEHPKESGKRYLAAFGRQGLSPSDVGAVLFTHLHPDHFGHKHLFPEATFIFHQDERFAFYFKNDRKVLLEGSALIEISSAGVSHPEYVDREPILRELGDKIYVRHAPGHTPGSIMIFACIGGLVHAWVGDIFLNQSYFDKWKPPGSSWKQDLNYQHMEYSR